MKVTNILIFYIVLCLSKQAVAKFSYKTFFENAKSIDDLSPECQRDVKNVPLFSPTFWTMFDATSKVSSGVAKSDVFSMGNFDQCLEIKEVETKFCSASINFQTIINSFNGVLPIFQSYNKEAVDIQQDVSKLILNFYVCVLKSCNAQDLNKMFNNIFIFEDSNCSTKDGKALDTLAIIAIIIFATIGLITIGSTFYDLYLTFEKEESPNQLAIAFSLYTNGKKLFNLSGSKHMDSLNGLKAITMVWVVFGHVFMGYTFAPLDNYVDALKWTKSVASQYVLGATVSVDTFFVITGFLTIYNFQATMDKGIKFNILLYYFHRYIRLTPALAAILLAHVALFNYFSTGPIWNRTNEYLVKGCENYWWSALLYIQNYVNPNGICVPQSWYLSVDMQLFLISPLLLLLIRQWPKCGYATLGLMSGVSILTSFLVGWFYKLNGQMTGNTATLSDFMSTYYMPTHTRMASYLFGLMLGYYVYGIGIKSRKPEFGRIFVLAAWILALAVMAACLFGGYFVQNQDEYERVSNSFYISLMRPSWAISICWVIFACEMGYGGPVNKLLSLPVLQILSRLSYSIYLIHYSFIFMTNFNQRSKLHFSDYNGFHKFWGDFACSVAIAVLWTLVFESPVIVLEKILLKKNKPTERTQKIKVLV